MTDPASRLIHFFNLMSTASYRSSHLGEVEDPVQGPVLESKIPFRASRRLPPGRQGPRQLEEGPTQRRHTHCWPDQGNIVKLVKTRHSSETLMAILRPWGAFHQTWQMSGSESRLKLVPCSSSPAVLPECIGA